MANMAEMLWLKMNCFAIDDDDDDDAKEYNHWGKSI
jgi:hypothetical protein